MRDKIVDGAFWSKLIKGLLMCCIHNVEDAPGLWLDDAVVDIIPGPFISENRCTGTNQQAHMVFL